MTGRSLDDELGRHWMDDVHSDDRSDCEGAFRGPSSRGGRRLSSTRVLGKDGTCRWLRDRVVPRYGDDGELSGFVYASLDITDRRTDEAKLRI